MVIPPIFLLRSLDSLELGPLLLLRLLENDRVCLYLVDMVLTIRLATAIREGVNITFEQHLV